MVVSTFVAGTSTLSSHHRDGDGLRTGRNGCGDASRAEAKEDSRLAAARGGLGLRRFELLPRALDRPRGGVPRTSREHPQPKPPSGCSCCERCPCDDLGALQTHRVKRPARIHVSEKEASSGTVRVLMILLHAAVALIGFKRRRSGNTTRIGRLEAAAVDVVLAREVGDGTASVAAKLIAARAEGSRADRAATTKCLASGRSDRVGRRRRTSVKLLTARTTIGEGLALAGASGVVARDGRRGEGVGEDVLGCFACQGSLGVTSARSSIRCRSAVVLAGSGDHGGGSDGRRSVPASSGVGVAWTASVPEWGLGVCERPC